MLRKMPWVIVEKTPVSFTSEDFWKALAVWDKVPHVVNRRLACAEPLFHEKLEDDPNGLYLKSAISKARDTTPLTLEQWEDVIIVLDRFGYSFPTAKVEHKLSSVEVILKKLIPKNLAYHSPILELEILEDGVDAAIYATLFSSPIETPISPTIPYKLSFKNGGISSFLELSVFKILEKELSPSLSIVDKSVEWLKITVLPKFCKWAASPSKASSGSLKLVSVCSYGALYQSLKTKYAAKLMDLWPENTDPQKFIHEDLGIAAYLLLLWEQERSENGLEKKQSFVDIGCGNGLLVYILNEEGHPGVGIDIRSRRIWDMYPSTTKLKVCTINPSENTPFPKMDWLIGNHSDELTPWIPVMAAMNPGSRYFVLPCCPHDFFGRYGRKNPGKSIYQEYLEFIKRDVSETLCKFVTNTDRLRIPSTKRVCIIGCKRIKENPSETYRHTTPHDFLIHVLGYKCSDSLTPIPGEEHGQTLFVPRPAKERVCNCTKMDPNVINEVVSLVSAEILSGPEEAHIYENGWDCGRVLALETLAKVIPSHLLGKMKKECGGLQTLLKNHHFIFKVTGGMVGFRKPIFKETVKKNAVNTVKNGVGKVRKAHWKSKPCWFNTHHPNGCPLLDAQCSYIHANLT